MGTDKRRRNLPRAVASAIVRRFRPAERASTPAPVKFSAYAFDRALALGLPDAPGVYQLPALRAEQREAFLAGRFSRVNFTRHFGYEPPSARVHFASAINDKYAPGLESVVLDLLALYPGFASPYHVWHDDSLSLFSRQRLASLYPGFVFHEGDPDDYALVDLGDAGNHKRVGLLGYLTVEALGLDPRADDVDRLVILDADLMILRDISPLWQGDTIRVVADAGIAPLAVTSESTGRTVVNSGVMSFPASELGPDALARAWRVLGEVAAEADPAIAAFADQKFWNLYLSKRPVEYLPQNFNTIRRLVKNFFPDALADVAVLHVTGPKPWFAFQDRSMISKSDWRTYQRTLADDPLPFQLWHQRFDHAIAKARIGAFAADEGPGLDALEGSAPRPAVLIGNGPSLARTDMSVFAGFEKFVFNWFVHHEDFDEIAPDHLVLPSAMFFGGWHTPRPEFPDGFLDTLTSHEHRPRLWTSYYFKPFIESVPELAGYEVSYFLFEKPFKQSIEKTGMPGLDLRAPLVDANTGVLTAGVPIALHLGAAAIVLVGCDSNYASQEGSYFYAAEGHTSRSTALTNLVSTWAGAEGKGQYSYLRTAEELAALGVPFRDATVGGALVTVPKIALAEVPALLEVRRGDSREAGADPKAGVTTR